MHCLSYIPFRIHKSLHVNLIIKEQLDQRFVTRISSTNTAWQDVCANPNCFSYVAFCF
jgi:hypothetical protein